MTKQLEQATDLIAHQFETAQRRINHLKGLIEAYSKEIEELEKQNNSFVPQNKDAVKEIDMTGRLCDNCNVGHFVENSIMCDIGGYLVCDNCNSQTPRWKEENAT